MKFNYRCPHCKKEYELTHYNAGWSGGIRLQCNSCPIQLHLSHYEIDHLQPTDEAGDFKSAIEDALLPCECGGKFVHDEPIRCPCCKQPLGLFDLMKQAKIFAMNLGITVTKTITSKDRNIWKAPQ